MQADDDKIYFGASQDVSITFDGSQAVIEQEAAAGPAGPLSIQILENVGGESLTITQSSTNTVFDITKGVFFFRSQETNGTLITNFQGSGTGWAEFAVYDQDDVNYLQVRHLFGGAQITTAGASPGILDLMNTADNNIRMFISAGSGETRELLVYGYRAGDAKRALEIGVGTFAADAASFDGVSNYHFDGNIRAGVAPGDASAIIQADSTTQGLLLPRMTTAQRNAIAAPATGLLIWNTDTGQLEDYNGAAWAAV
jgi:hypothetical protein